MTSSNLFLRRVALPMIALFAAGFAIMAVVQDAGAFERKVLFEDFTSTTCPPCAAAAPALHQALEDVTPELVSSVAYHVWWPAPGNDPWMQANRPENEAKVNFYGVRAAPTYLIDGTSYNGSRTAAAFANAIRQRQRTESPLQIRMNGRLVGDVVETHVEVTSSQNLRNVTLHIALTEEYWQYNAPTGQRDHYDSMIKMIPNASGTGFSIDADQTLTWDFQTNIANYGWHELEADNLILNAWVQSGNQEVHQSQNYYLGYNSPLLRVAGFEINDADGDSRAEIGETTSIAITLENQRNYLPAETFRVTFATDDEGIIVENGVFEGENLEPEHMVNNNDNPFTFRVNEGFEAHPVLFTITMEAQPGDFSDSQELEFMVEWPPFLVVDASSHQNAGEMVIQPFGQNELPWADNWNRVDDGYVNGEGLENYDIILWHSFNNLDDPITEFEIDILTEYLNNGGMLVISSPYALINFGDNPFFADMLGVELNEANNRGNFVQGVEGDPDFEGATIFLGGGNGAGFPAAKPTMNPVNGGEPVMFYQSAGENLGWAAIKRNAENYRTLTLAFPMESIGGVAGTQLIHQFMEHIWHWANNPVTVPGFDSQAPAVFALSPAFPNPFNASTVIPFSLERTGYAKLGLFDLTGRLVTTLVNGRLGAGAHLARLDAGAVGLTGGVYIVRLQTESQSASTKMLYLK